MKKMKIGVALACCALAAIAAGAFALYRPALAEPGHEHGASGDKAAAPTTASSTAHPGAPYPLDYCVVTGEKLDSMGGAVLYDHEGREIRFCCSACIPKFEAEPAKYIAEIDEAIIAQQLDSYALEICPISGMELGDEPVNAVIENRLVRFCCGGCAANFAKDPNFEEIDAAIIAAQSEDYALTTCPVSGAELGDAPVDHVMAGHLFKLCCSGCIAELESDPAKYIAMLESAEDE